MSKLTDLHFTELTINDLTVHHSDIMILHLKDSCDRINADLPLRTPEERHKEALEMVGRLRHTFYQDLYAEREVEN